MYELCPQNFDKHIENGLDVNQKDENGEYLVQREAKKCFKSSSLFTLLVEAGADVNVVTPKGDHLVRVLLSIFYHKNREVVIGSSLFVELVQLLFDHGFEIPDKDNDETLNWVCRFYPQYVSEKLIDLGFSVESIDESCVSSIIHIEDYTISYKEQFLYRYLTHPHVQLTYLKKFSKPALK